MILVHVRRSGFQESTWDSYLKVFPSEREFLAWWRSLPDTSFTKNKELADVTIYSGDIFVFPA